MQDARIDTDQIDVTRRLAEFVVAARPQAMSQRALRWATHTLLDWTGVTLAARDEPSVQMLIDELCDPAVRAGKAGVSALVLGQGHQARLLDAVLINGTAGHALDYDDVNPLLGGHPSVPTIPVALALAEILDSNGLDVLTAIVTGIEVECAIGSMTGTSHYEHGFHNTATIGTFGAAATAAYLMRLDVDQTRMALSLAASEASGLKCNFGTMTKPFHAGAAASKGLRAARLAARGFTANGDAISCHQGFAGTQVPQFDASAWRSPFEASTTDTVADPEQRRFGIERTLFKFHAACYGTHGVLGAAGKLRREHSIGLDDIAKVKLYVTNRSQGQCDQPAPETGLAMKFSTQHLVVAALDGVDTAALDTYSAAVATAPRLVAARDRVAIQFETERDRYIADVEVTLNDGRVLTAQGNVGIPASDLDDQWRALASKFDALAVPLLGDERAAKAKATIGDLAQTGSLAPLLATLA